MSVTVLLEFKFKPESVPTARELMGRELQKTRDFDGNLALDVLVDEDDEAHWIVYELWESVAHDETYRAFRAGDGKIVDLSKQMPRGPKTLVEILADAADSTAADVESLFADAGDAREAVVHRVERQTVVVSWRIAVQSSWAPSGATSVR